MKRLGHCGLFSERDTIQEAYDYLDKVSSSFGQNRVLVMTAAMVLANTIVREAADLLAE